MKKIVSIFMQLIFMAFPWYLRRYLLFKILGFEISKSASIGLSIILSEKVIMAPCSRIGNFTFCNSIDLLNIDEHSKIGNINYITGYPSSLKKFFRHVANRKCELNVGKHSAITSRHFIDCTAGVNIGDFTIIGGIRSQILSHSIDLFLNRQDAIPVEIGNFCFVGTNCCILPGSKLPDYSILGANALLNKKFNKTNYLYGGVPAKRIKNMPREEIAYFSRIKGFVD